MHHITLRWATTVVALALTAAAALGVGAASASAQAPATGSATSTAENGMRYFSTGASTTIRVTLSATTFTVDDGVPITPGTGCKAVAGDATKVTCTAFKGQFNAFKQFFVDAETGDDTVINATSIAGATGAPMRAIGDGGADVLVGANQVNDVLEGLSGADTLRGGDESTGGNVHDQLKGGAGNDKLQGGRGRDRLEGSTQSDQLDGGDGADTLDGGSHADVIDGGLADSGGFFSEDIVLYERVSPVTVDLRRIDASQGASDENDKILRVENARGGRGNDTLIGNADNNLLIAGLGNDVVSGMEGRDTLLGEEGNDFLFPSPDSGFIGVIPDGVQDIMDCGDDDNNADSDLAFRVLADGDLVNKCEQAFDV
jgi:Ca2+-binding RTX toxin-like protein